MELAHTYITPESLRMASVLVSQAIDKYNTMENEREQYLKNNGNVAKETSNKGTTD